MTRKKMEGDEQMRRRKARAAKKRGEAPSEAAATSGASKQRHHLPRQEQHDEKIETVREGKQPMIRQRTPRGRSRKPL